MIGVLLRVLSWAVRLILAAFFVFVGYWKALGPIAALAEHRAWVAYLPDWASRAVGWQEIVCALMLLLAPAFPATRAIAYWGAALLLLNQLAALGVHALHGEAVEAAPQNVAICALLIFVIALTRPIRKSA